MFLVECKYVLKEKKTPEYITNERGISSDEENEESSDEENFSEQN